MTTARVRPIASLPVAGPLDGSEIIPAIKDGASQAVTIQKISDFLESASSNFWNKTSLPNPEDIPRFSINRSGVALPQKLTQAERDRDGFYSLNNWLTPAARAQSTRSRYDITADSSPALVAALASGEDVAAPRGRYLLTYGGAVMTREGQRFRGSGRESCEFFLKEDYLISSGSPIKMLQNCEAEDFSFHCSQFDNTATYNFPETRGGVVYPNRTNLPITRDSAIKYPWLIDINNSARVRLRRIRMQQAWNGIYGYDNVGGLDTDQLELGCLNGNILVDGALDFVSLRGTHVWPFGFAQRSDLMAFFRDGNTIALDMGQCESFDIQGIKMFGGKVRMRLSAFIRPGSSVPGFPFGTITGISGDGNASWVEVSAGRCVVAGAYSTKDGFSQLGFVSTGGVLIVSAADIDHNSDTPAIYCGGGVMQVSGSTVRSYNPEARAALVEGSGELILLANNIEGFNGPQNRTQPFILQAGNSTLRALGNTFKYKRSDQTGVAFNVSTNGPKCVVANNDLGGWGLDFGPNGGRVQGNF